MASLYGNEGAVCAYDAAAGILYVHIAGHPPDGHAGDGSTG